MLVSVNIPTTDVKRGGKFYNYLLKNELGAHPFSREALYMNVSACALTMFPRHQADETTTCYFEVRDLSAAITELVNLGGKVIAAPFPIKAGTITRQAAVIADPDGNGIGLVTEK